MYIFFHVLLQFPCLNPINFNTTVIYCNHIYNLGLPRNPFCVFSIDLFFSFCFCETL